MKPLQKTDIIAFFIIIFIILLRLYHTNICFFWDPITTISKTANFLYKNNFSLQYPDTINNGDPQIIQLYLALCWKIFGRSLFVSHLTFLPILIITLYQLFILCRKFILNNAVIISFMVLLSEATLITQSLMLSYEIYLIGFSALAINSLLSGKKEMFALSLVLLTLISRRGMIICSGIILSYYYYEFFIRKESLTIKSFIQKSYPIIPAVVTVILFLIYRFYYFGWVFTHDNSPWKETGNLTNLKGIIKNCMVFVWQYVDSARIFLCCIILFMIVRFRKQKLDDKLKYLWFLFITLNIVFIVITLPLQNPIGNRFYMLHFLILNLMVQTYLFNYLTQNKAKIISVLLIFILLSGNYWNYFYPEKLAKHWEVSLSHLPYYDLRKKCYKYIDDNKIPYSDIATDGLNLEGNQKFVDLIPVDRLFTGDKTHCEYYIYSNISNSNDEIIDEIHNQDKWKLLFENKKAGVFVNIYERIN